MQKRLKNKQLMNGDIGKLPFKVAKEKLNSNLIMTATISGLLLLILLVLTYQRKKRFDKEKKEIADKILMGKDPNEVKSFMRQSQLDDDSLNHGEGKESRDEINRKAISIIIEEKRHRRGQQIDTL